MDNSNLIDDNYAEHGALRRTVIPLRCIAAGELGVRHDGPRVGVDPGLPGHGPRRPGRKGAGTLDQLTLRLDRPELSPTEISSLEAALRTKAAGE